MRARSSSLLALALLLGGPGAGCRRSSLPPRPDGAAVVVAPGTPPGEAGVAFAPELEPNDGLPSAQRLDLLAGQARGVAASLHEGQGRARDVDLYRVDIPAPDGGLPPPGPDGAAPPVLRRSLRIDVRPEAVLAVALDALDDRGQALVSAPSGPVGEGLSIPNLAVSPGTYYLRVRSAGASAAPGSYRLVVRLAPLDAGAEIEPNGKGTLATLLDPNAEAVGYAGWRRDQDWYRVPTAGLAEGSVLSADLEPVPGVTASLLVTDSVEQKLVEARGRNEERVALRSVRVPPGEPHLYVVVRTDAGWNGEVRYNLRLRAELPRAGGEAEPNDDPAHAQPVGDGTVLGTLARGDSDVYRYVAAAALELDVEITPPERVDARLEVLRPDGTVLARADAGGRREPERLPNLFVPPGPVFIRVSAGKGDGNPDEPYRLTIASRTPEPGAEREPNDTIATPTPLAPGSPGTGLAAPRGDVDFWQAAATPDGDGKVAVTVTSVPGLALEVRVRSQAGRELGRFKVAAGAPAASHLLAAGEACCLLEVREASGRAANPRDRYTVVIGK